MASRFLAGVRARLQSARRAFLQSGPSNVKVNRRKLRFESLERREVLTSIALTIDAPTDADEGIAFTVTGHVSPAGSYTLEGDGYGYYLDFPVTTDENGEFTVSYLFGDDGPHPGNGTPSDVETIDMTVWISGEPENTATDSASVTINNVDPTLDFQVSQSDGLFEVTGVVNEYSPAVPMMDYQLVRINWGDGSPEDVLCDVVPGVPIDAQYHEYPFLEESYTITVTATDDDTGTGTWVRTVETCLCSPTDYAASLPPPALEDDSPFVIYLGEGNAIDDDVDLLTLEGSWDDPGSGGTSNTESCGDPEESCNLQENPQPFKWKQIRNGAEVEEESQFPESIAGAEPFGQTRSNPASAKFELEMKIDGPKCTVIIKNAYIDMEMDVARFVKGKPVPAADQAETIAHERIHVEKRLQVFAPLKAWVPAFNIFLAGIAADKRHKAADAIVKEVNAFARNWLEARMKGEASRQLFHFDHKAFRIRTMDATTGEVKQEEFPSGRKKVYGDNFQFNLTFQQQLIEKAKSYVKNPASVTSAALAEEVINGYNAQIDALLTPVYEKIIEKAQEAASQ